MNVPPAPHPARASRAAPRFVGAGLVAVAAIQGCERPPAGLPVNHPPAVSLLLEPAAPRDGDDLTLRLRYSDPDGHRQAGREVRWYADGGHRPEHDDRLVVPGGETLPLEEWRAEARVQDEEGLWSDWASSNTVRIAERRRVRFSGVVTDVPGHGVSLELELHYAPLGEVLRTASDPHGGFAFEIDVEDVDGEDCALPSRLVVPQGRFYRYEGGFRLCTDDARLGKVALKGAGGPIPMIQVGGTVVTAPPEEAGRVEDDLEWIKATTGTDGVQTLNTDLPGWAVHPESPVAYFHAVEGGPEHLSRYVEAVDSAVRVLDGGGSLFRRVRTPEEARLRIEYTDTLAAFAEAGDPTFDGSGLLVARTLYVRDDGAGADPLEAVWAYVHALVHVLGVLRDSPTSPSVLRPGGLDGALSPRDVKLLDLVRLHPGLDMSRYRNRPEGARARSPGRAAGDSPVPGGRTGRPSPTPSGTPPP